MQLFDSKKFAEVLQEKCLNHNVRKCPFCGGSDFTTTKDFAAITIGSDHSKITLGPVIPSGMIICKKCGHIDFFALGALDLIPSKEDKNDEK